MAETARRLPAIAALEAAIPDAALVFACLGIALAQRGRRACALNLASVAASMFMNTLAAEPGWHNLAIWALPPVAYALASDTLISVVRVRHQHLADEAVLAECPSAPGRRPAPAPHPGKATCGGVGEIDTGWAANRAAGRILGARRW
jgi:hypothetical protein